MNEMIRVEGLEKRYDGFSLEKLDLIVETGYVVGLIGSNGAGKTTLIQAICGIIEPDGGTVSLIGEDIAGESASISKAKQHVGIVLDTCAFPITMRVRDVGMLGSAAYHAWDSALFARLCDKFELAGKKQVKDLSRGMGMKLTLAFALSHHPDLLILDEATAGLDPIARDEILDVIRDFMAEGNRAVLFSTHITTDLEKVADKVVCIDDGRLIFDLDKEDITDRAGLAHCRETDLDGIRASADEPLRMMRRGLSIDVLTHDRAAFAQTHPSIDIDRISIEDYMTLTLKGETI